MEYLVDWYDEADQKTKVESYSDRAVAERRARAISRSNYDGAYCIAYRGREPIGQRIYFEGRLSETVADYR